jgi:ABC-type transporter Mla subunit MlaD
MAELGKRQRALTAIVTGGRRVLATFGEHEIDLGATLRELPTLVSTARSTLGNVRPLLVQAKPLVRDLTSAALRLRAAAAALPATAGAARELVAKLPTLDATALPFLRRALPVLTAARPFARVLLPVLENLVPILEYAAPRADDLAGWFSKTLSGGLQQDSKGHWVRFLVFVDPRVAGGIDRGAQYRNPYPGPQDAANPQPFRPGSYPRLQPYFRK